jgi:elongation factor Ts
LQPIIPIEAIKRLRELTGAGIMECKKALTMAEGDVERAFQALRAQGLALAEKKASRVASQGLVEAYLHAGGRIGALVEVNCETDFVARTDTFQQLAHDLAMQIAAMNPRYISLEEVSPEDHADPKEVCLLSQPFIKNPELTVQDLIKDCIARLGENIRVRRFARFELGD